LVIWHGSATLVASFHQDAEDVGAFSCIVAPSLDNFGHNST
jgi:hypothetical protein